MKKFYIMNYYETYGFTTYEEAVSYCNLHNISTKEIFTL